MTAGGSAWAAGLDASAPWQRFASHRSVHAAILGAITVAVLLHYGPDELPYRGDRSYFTYLGQSVLRGDSIYRVSFLAYPPLSPLLGASHLCDAPDHPPG